MHPNSMYPHMGMQMYPIMPYGNMHPQMPMQMVDDQIESFQAYGTFCEPNGVLDPITALSFDPHEELIWTGSSTGRIVSYHGSTMQKYTSWRAHYDDVRQFLLNEQGITSIGSNNIRFYSREGKLQLSHSHEELDDLSCALWISPTNFLVGSASNNSLDIFDLRRGRVTKSLDTHSTVTCMSRSSKYLCVGHGDGSVSIRDTRSYRTENSLKPHSTHVSCLDVKSDLLVTCGYSNRNNKTAIDPLIRVYDLRTMRLLQAIQFHARTNWLKFHPRLSSTIAVTSVDGQLVQLMDVQQQGYGQQGYVTHQWYMQTGQEILAADFCSTGECLAFGDSDGYTHLWTDPIVSHSNHLTSPGFKINNFDNGKLVKIDPRPPAPSWPIGDSLLSPPWIVPLLVASSTSSLGFDSSSYANSSSLSMGDVSSIQQSEKQNVIKNLTEQLNHLEGIEPKDAIIAHTVTNTPSQTADNLLDISTNTDDDFDSTPIQSANQTPKTPSKAEQNAARLAAASSTNRSHNNINYNDSHHEQGLSVLQEDIFFPVKAPQPIDPELLKGMRVTDGCGVIPTVPGTRRRNLATRNFLDNPSLQQISTDLSGEFLDAAYDEAYNMPPGTPGVGVPSKSKAPKSFRFIPTKHAGGFESFDYSPFNRTNFSGLENMLSLNTSCFNPIIQVLYCIPQIRAGVLNHLCSAEYCSMCELSFLFHMMDLQGPADGCKTSCPKNFMRTLRELPKASNSGLFEEDSTQQPLSQLLQKFNKFFLLQLYEESTQSASQIQLASSGGTITGPIPNRTFYCDAAESIVDTMFGSTIKSTRTCGSCMKLSVVQNHAFYFKLRYPDDPGDNILRGRTPNFASLLRNTLTQQFTTHSFCDKCCNFQVTQTFQEVEELPPIIGITCDLSEETTSFWRSVSDEYSPLQINTSVDHWLPFVLKITKDESNPGHWLIHEFNKVPEGVNDDELYELTAVVSSIQDDQTQHSVCQVRMTDLNYLSRTTLSVTNPADYEGPSEKWFLFNDFYVTPCTKLDAVHISSEWKTPCILHYTRRSAATKIPPAPLKNPIVANPQLFFESNKSCSGGLVLTEETLKSDFEPEFSIDAEFVLLKEEESESRHGGLKMISSPAEFGLARVSVVGAKKSQSMKPLHLSHNEDVNLRVQDTDEIQEQFLEEACIMDDYVVTSHDSIVDYLTQYSGISPGDLNPLTSKHNVTTLKSIYIKLRYLVDTGHVFVGHGLKKDFSIINIVVPKEQVIDTVEIYHLENQRYISLRFLASILLGLDIQQTTHDSIEDSRTALLLYRLSRQLTKEGKFDEVLQEIYQVGRLRNWKIYKEDRIVDTTTIHASAHETEQKPKP